MASTKKFRTNYEKTTRNGIVFSDLSRTMQSSKDECDINKIMKKFEKTGVLPELIKSNPSYGDFSDPVDYQEACNIVIHARAQFDALSSRVRERFANDPEKFLQFATDPRNSDEMVTLGLATKIVQEETSPKKGDSTHTPDEKGKTPKS